MNYRRGLCGRAVRGSSRETEPKGKGAGLPSETGSAACLGLPCCRRLWAGLLDARDGVVGLRERVYWISFSVVIFQCRNWVMEVWQW